MTTGVDQRDNHLRSPDFLDAENHPTITGRVLGVEAVGERYRVIVDLTIRDMTRPVTLDAEFLGFFAGMQGGRRVGFHLAGTLLRKEWGLNWNMALEAGGFLVGEEVQLEIEVAADEFAG